jgi:hypothetical protein
MLIALFLFEGTGSSHASGVQGTVVLWPTSPVERAGHPAEKPVAATIDVTSSSGEIVAKGHSDESGKFCITLAPGTYVLTPQPLRPGSLTPRARSQTIVVKAGEFTQVRLVYDTGIR